MQVLHLQHWLHVIAAIKEVGHLANNEQCIYHPGIQCIDEPERIQYSVIKIRVRSYVMLRC